MHTSQFTRAAMTIGLTLVLGLSAIAQNTMQSPPPMRSNTWMMYTDTLGRSLHLTPQQMNDMNTLNNRYQGDYKKLGDAGMNSPEYRGLNDRRNKDIQGILTPQQYEQWQTMDRQRMPDHGTMDRTTPNKTNKPGQDNKVPPQR